MKDKTFYDISVMLGLESIDYPGDTPYDRKLICSMDSGDAYDLSSLSMSAHSGTHIDAPAHFIPGGKTLDQYPVESFMLSAKVVETHGDDLVRPEEFSKVETRPGEALLFKTRNSSSGDCRNGCFSEQFVSLSLEAADLCVERKLGLVGLDYITIEKAGDLSFPVHKRLMAENILILEGIDLSAVSAGRYTLLCLPLKTDGAEAAPLRAVLMK